MRAGGSARTGSGEAARRRFARRAILHTTGVRAIIRDFGNGWETMFDEFAGETFDLLGRDRGSVVAADDGVPLAEFADAVFARLAKGEVEIGHGPSDHFRTATHGQLAALYRQLNGLAS